MPEHKVHLLIDKIILGKEYKHVHRTLDEPYKWLGSRHRVSRHDPLWAFLRFGFSEEFISACLHIATDYGVSEAKRKVRKRSERRKKRKR